MKFSPSQLKNLNYKQLAIDHGEKGVLGLVAVLSLLFLVRAPWKQETRTPEELSAKVAEGQQKVRTSVWPETEMKKYSTANTIGARVNQMLSPLSTERFAMTTETIWPLIKRHEPIKEPELVPVEELIATPGKVILALGQKAAETELAQNGDEPPADGAGADAPGDDLAVKNKERNRGTGAGAAAGPGDFTTPLPATATGTLGPAVPGVGTGASPYSAGGAASMTEVRGYRFIAIRGIVNLRKQAEKIARARNESIVRSTEDVQYLDFILERQKAVAGDDPWTGPWEKVDTKIAQDRLAEANSFEVDVVDDAVIDPVFTMPLPERVAGEWDYWASHPRVKDFLLTPEGKELAQKLSEELLKFKSQQEADEKERGPQKGGFSGHKHNMREIRGDIAGSASMMNRFSEQMNISMGGDPNNRGLTGQMKQKVTAGGTLLLFRYFDFDVEPGNAYRYRVQLVLQNPSFGLSPDQVVEPTVAEGADRKTAWSTESQPAVIGEDAKYYLSRVDPSRVSSLPSATFNIYQWNQPTGTPVNDDKAKALLGQRIGGDTTTKVVSIPNKVSDETVHFNTGDYLIDAAKGQPVDDGEFARFAGFHGDLKMASDGKSRPVFADKAVVLNEFGELVPIDSVSRKPAEKQQKDRQENFIKIWEKELESSKASNQMSAADELAAGYMPQEAGKKKGKKATDNTRIMPGAAPAGGYSMPPATQGAPGATKPNRR